MAFSYLVKQYQKIILNVSLNILHNLEDAEDVTQEVFISASQAIRNFKGESKISTWLYRIAMMKSLEHIRKHKTQKRFAFVISLFQNEEKPIDVGDKSHSSHPGVILENKQRTQILFQAIEKLPEKQRISFVLNKLEGLSYEEVGSVMQLSLSSIESLIFRAKQNLRTLLENYYDQNEK